MKNLLLSILALVAILFANPAFANGNGQGNQCQGNSCGGNGGNGGNGQGGDAEVDDSGNSEVGNGIGNFSPDASATSVQGQQQGQQQGQTQGQIQGQAQNSDDDFVIEGDTTTYEAARIPVNSAAPVFAGSCSQGVSMQFPTAGASAGTGNPVCDYVAVAGAFVAAGERTEALRVLAKAEESADSRALLAKIRGWLTLGLL